MRSRSVESSSAVKRISPSLRHSKLLTPRVTEVSFSGEPPRMSYTYTCGFSLPPAARKARREPPGENLGEEAPSLPRVSCRVVVSVSEERKMLPTLTFLPLSETVLTHAVHSPPGEMTNEPAPSMSTTSSTERGFAGFSAPPVPGADRAAAMMIIRMTTTLRVLRDMAPPRGCLLRCAPVFTGGGEPGAPAGLGVILHAKEPLMKPESHRRSHPVSR